MIRLFLSILLAAFQDGSTRTAEPDAAQQKEALKGIKELFKADYARKLPAERLDLARKLLQGGLETTNDPATKFVLLKEALDLAVLAGDPDLAVAAADGTAKAFQVDGPALKFAALGRIAVKEADVARATARACLGVATEAVEAENFEVAGSAAQRAEALAKGAQEPALASRAAELKAETASIKAESGRVKVLLQKPAEGDAEAVGRYLCFVRGDWEGGLPFLAAGGKGAVKAAAEKDQGRPADAAARAELADAWWELAQKEKSAWRRERILRRVRHWLDLATTEAAGIVKIRVQKRMDELEALQPGFVNLLRMVDPAKDGVFGTWKLEDGKLTANSGKLVRLEFPYQPPAEYDMRMVFQCQSGFNVSHLLSRQGKAFCWIWEFGLDRAGLGNCRNCWITDPNNPSLVTVPPLPRGTPVTSLIEVRKDRVRAFLNGKLVAEYKTDYADLSMNDNWKLRSPQLLGIGCWESPTEFLKIDLVEISGKGKRLR